MKIALGTIDVTDTERAAVAHYYGQRGLASRETMRRFITDNGRTVIEHDLITDLEAHTERALCSISS